MIYLDNAATSFPKPARVVNAIAHYCTSIGANPGRSAHSRARDASGIVARARQRLADLLGATDPSRVIFTPSATVALNLAFKGILRDGDHVLTTSMEHNSVLRPLHHLETLGIPHDQIPCSPEGELDPADILPLLRPQTRLMVLLHASNVTGGLMPVSEVATLARERGILVLIDAAQTMGTVPVNPENLRIDLLAGSGHKGLLGPMGTGFLYARPGLDLEPLWHGGTGTHSESFQQPETWPERFESGTCNAPGLAGLAEGVAEIQAYGLESIAAHERSLIKLLFDGLSQLQEIILYGPLDRQRCIGTLSFNVEGLDCTEVAHILDRSYGIAVRPGMHCAPAAHRTLGTFPHGSVRASVGPYSTEDEIHTLIEAVADIVRLRGEYQSRKS